MCVEPNSKPKFHDKMKNEKRKFFMMALIGAHGPLLFYTMFKPAADTTLSTDTQTTALVSKTDSPSKSNKSFYSTKLSFSKQDGKESISSLEHWLNKLLYNTEEENQELAAFLREHIRSNPEAMEAVSKMMLDPKTPIRSFANLAMILGTLDDPQVEELLLQTLEMYEADPDRAQWAIYALGTWKNSPSVDARFSFHERGPNTLKTIEGLATPLFQRFRFYIEQFCICLVSRYQAASCYLFGYDVFI